VKIAPLPRAPEPAAKDPEPVAGATGDSRTPPVAPATGSRAPVAPPPASAPAVDTANWVQHTDKVGFAVQHPRGWAVEPTGDGMIVVRSADRACVAVVMPFFARGTAAQECLMQALHFLAPVLPQARVTKAAQKSRAPDVVLASLAYDAGGREGHAALLTTVFDRSGMLFVIGAPADQYAAGQPVLLRVLQTFRFTKPTGPAPAGGAADAGLRYIPWQDPNEQAFTVEVPEGWKVTGGLIRRNAVDPRGCLQIASPEGDVVISSGEATVPTFTLPGFSEFFPEGSDYSPGYGVAMKVMRYKTGTQFAGEYVQTRVAQSINDVAVTGSRDRPDIAQAINEINARYSIGGVQTQLTMGEVTFTGRYQSKAVEGYWFAGTQLTTVASSGAPGLWNVPNLIGYVATPEKAPLAQAVMGHMVNSTSISPQWVAMQQGLTANVSKIVSETNNAISSIITKTYENRQAAQDNISRKWSNMMLGQTDLVDPDTGQTYKAASGHNYYWVRPGLNTGVGTNTYDRPDINLVPLVEW
jgi:hypothetical protein